MADNLNLKKKTDFAALAAKFGGGGQGGQGTVTSDSNVPDLEGTDINPDTGLSAGFSPLVSTRPGTPGSSNLPDVDRTYSPEVPDLPDSHALGLIHDTRKGMQETLSHTMDPLTDPNMLQREFGLMAGGTGAAEMGIGAGPGTAAVSATKLVPAGRAASGRMLPWTAQQLQSVAKPSILSGAGTMIAGAGKALSNPDNIEKLAKFYLYNKLLNRIGLKGVQDIVP